MRWWRQLERNVQYKQAYVKKMLEGNASKPAATVLHKNMTQGGQRWARGPTACHPRDARLLGRNGEKAEGFRHPGRLGAVTKGNTEMSERLTVEQVSRDLVKRARERAADPRKIWGIPWGFAGLDGLTGGIHSEEMTVLMARPGVGKTQFMGQTALQVAEYLMTPEGKRLHPNEVVKLVLCEMSAASFQQRIVCYKANVGQRKVREGTLSRESLARYEEAAESHCAPAYRVPGHTEQPGRHHSSG